MWPWKAETLLVAAIPGVLFVLSESLPAWSNLYLDTAIRSTMLLGLAGMALFIRPLFPGDWKL
jgi:hypothetical protein